MKLRMWKSLSLGCMAVMAWPLLAGGGEAMAAEPQQSNLVDPPPRIDVEPNFSRDFHNAQTAYAGIAQCERLVDENRTISVEYDTVTGVDMTDSQLFGGVYMRGYERGEEGQVNCRNQDGDLRDECTEISSDDISRFVDGVDAEVSFEDLTGFEDPAICEEGEIDRSYYIQLRLRDYTGAGTTTGDWQRSEVRFVFDLIRPGSPTLEDAFATETSIMVEFEESTTDDVETHHVFWSRSAFSAGELASDISSRSPRRVGGSESGEISVELDPGETIYVAMVARDRAGNYSTVSEPIEVQVTQTNDFWDYYVDAGGAETGGYGCQQSGGQGTTIVLVLAGLLGLALVRRRRRGVALAATAAVALLAMSPTVEASDSEDLSGFFQIGFGPYGPSIDDEFEGTGPYEEFFGDDSLRYIEGQADAHLWQGVGKLSLGFHAGYGRVRATARDDDGQRLETDDTATFRIIPLKTSLVYRYDYSAHNHNIPLVPVAKAGLNYNFWRAKNTAGDTSQVDDQRGSGGMLGWHAALGLHLHLNFFDPRNAASFDMTWNVANSYLFFEYEWTRVGDFGDSVLNLDANHWSVGLAFEF